MQVHAGYGFDALIYIITVCDAVGLGLTAAVVSHLGSNFEPSATSLVGRRRAAARRERTAAERCGDGIELEACCGRGSGGGRGGGHGNQLLRGSSAAGGGEAAGGQLEPPGASSCRCAGGSSVAGGSCSYFGGAATLQSCGTVSRRDTVNVASPV